MKKLLFLTVIIMLLLSFFIYFKYKETKHNEILSKSLATTHNVLKDKLNLKEDFSKHLNIKLNSILNNSEFRNYLNTNKNLENIQNLFLSIIEQNSDFFQLRYIDLYGNEIIRIDKSDDVSVVVSSDKLQNKKNRYYFTKALENDTDSLWFSKLDLNIEHGQLEKPYRPTLRVAKVVFNKDKKFGILIANINMSYFLDKLIDSRNNEVYLLDKDNYLLISNTNKQAWSRYITKKVFDNIDIFKLNTVSSNFTISSDEELKLFIKPKNDYINTLLKERISNLLLFLFLFNIFVIFIVLLIISNKILKNRIKKELLYENNLNETINSYVALTKTDKNGIIIYVSDEFSKITGYNKSELIGKNHSYIKSNRVSPDVFKDLWTTILQGKIYNGVIPIITKNGNERTFEIKICPEFDSDKNIVGYSAFRKDITEKIELKELNNSLEEKIKEKTIELKKLNEELEEKVKIKTEENIKKEKLLLEQVKLASMGEMIGNIAHQWRQPLSYISTASTGIIFQKEVDSLNDEFLIETLNKINTTTQYLSNTIETFRDFIKEEKTIVNVVIQNRISACLEILKGTLNSAHIKVINNTLTVDPISIDLIKGELTQTLINIITNAKDILVEREISNPWVKIDIEEADDKVTISIEDNAGGISDDVITHVFEPYFTTKHKSKGTGLGLYMCYKIVIDSLKGKLFVKNSEHGAKFFIEIPKKNNSIKND